MPESPSLETEPETIPVDAPPDRRGARDDAEILRRMAGGDQRALAQLVSLHGSGLRGFCRRYLGNAADADEVVQDVFFKAWRNADHYRPDTAKVSTWLYRIAVNRCIDVRRARAFKAFIGLGNREETEPSEAPDPLRHVESRDAFEKARTAISALPDRQRMAILITVSGGLDNAETAAAMGISPGAVEQLLVRARRTLRTSLEAEPASAGPADRTGEP